MGSDESEVMKEWLVRIIYCVILEAINRVVRGSDCDIEITFVFRGFKRNVINEYAFRTEKIALVGCVVRTIKSAIENFSIDVPFSAMVAAVAMRLKVLWQQLSPALTRPSIATFDPRQFISVYLVWVVTG